MMKMMNSNGEMKTTSGKSKCEELKEKILMAIFAGDVDALRATMDPLTMTFSERKRLRKVLLRTQSFSALAEPSFNGQMLDILMEVLVRSCPDVTTLSAEPRPRTTSEDLLKAYLKAYRGHLIHLAAALDRGWIILDMVTSLMCLGWFHGARRLLEAKDSEGHTALMIAVLGRRHRAMDALSKLLRVSGHTHTARVVLPEAFLHCTFQLLSDPGLLKTVNKFCLENITFLRLKHVCVYLPIFTRDLRMLKILVKDENRGLEVDGGLPALHAAVRFYSGFRLDAVHRTILEYLIDCPDLPPDHRRVSVNDVFSVTFQNGVRSSGTVAHYAVCPLAVPLTQAVNEQPSPQDGRFRPSKNSPNDARAVSRCTNKAMVKEQIDQNLVLASELNEELVDTGSDRTHIGAVLFSYDHTWPDLNIHTRERHVVHVMEMLDLLHQHGADFSLVNADGKTPLDLLPPDVDSRVLGQVIALVHLGSKRTRQRPGPEE